MFVLLFQNSQGVNPKDSFAWKDKSLDLELKALRDARFDRRRDLQRLRAHECLKRGFLNPQVQEGGDARWRPRIRSGDPGFLS